MHEESWTFQTARGAVTIGEDAIEIRETPRDFLAGQRSRWRHGSRWTRTALAFRSGGFVYSMLSLLYHLRTLSTTGPNFQTPSHVFVFLLFAYLLWSNHVGTTTIPLSTVETVVLDESAGELEISHEPTRSILPSFSPGDDDETTLTLPSTTAVREATEVFRLRGIDLETPETAGDAMETTYRVVVRDGACFCERCTRQVSPSDGICPACGYEIRVRTPVGRDSAADESDGTAAREPDGTAARELETESVSERR